MHKKTIYKISQIEYFSLNNYYLVFSNTTDTNLVSSFEISFRVESVAQSKIVDKLVFQFKFCSFRIQWLRLLCIEMSLNFEMKLLNRWQCSRSISNIYEKIKIICICIH